jgi:AraC-like DNA-binding protein
MAIELNLVNGEPLESQLGLPSDYSGPILSGASATFVKSSVAALTIQELIGHHYSIRHSVAKFFQRVAGNSSLHKQGLYASFMLKNEMRKEIYGIGKIHVRQDQYSCLYTEPTHCNARFEKEAEYRAIDIFFSPKMLEELLPFFPELKAVVTSSSALLTGKACWMLPSMKEVINQLLNCPFDEATRQFYFDLKVRELLYQMLENAYKRKQEVRFFTPWEIARIHDARTILGDHVSKKPPSIRSLSKKVALNEFKLKTGFRQYVNSGIFEWLMDEKMQFAKQLLLTTNKPIKEISALVGYPRTTNFITAFRRRFGMTPGSMRRS